MSKLLNAYPLGVDKKKDYALIFLGFCLACLYGIIYQLQKGWYSGGGYMTTLLAFSYFQDGLRRRTLPGTLYELICRLIPSAFSAKGATWFMWAVNALFFTVLLLFIRWALCKVDAKGAYKGLFVFSLFCLSFLVPCCCYSSSELGRADIMQMTLCLVQVYLLVEMKHEWLTVPFTILNTLIHEGYIMMTFGSVLIVLIYRAMNAEKSKNRYLLLIILNLLALISTTLLSLYTSGNGTFESYSAALNRAIALNSRGEYHSNLLFMMSGFTPEDAVFVNDAAFKASAIRELPFFLLCLSPILILFGKSIHTVLQRQCGKKKTADIIALFVGPLLIAPEYVLYCDFGRYFWWLVFYFFVVFLSFSVMGDEAILDSLEKNQSIRPESAFLFFILMLFAYEPLLDCNFTILSRALSNYICG